MVCVPPTSTVTEFEVEVEVVEAEALAVAMLLDGKVMLPKLEVGRVASELLG